MIKRAFRIPILIRSIALSGMATFPSAPALAAEPGDGAITGLSSLIQAGGPIMYPIVGLALVAIGVAVVKAVQFFRIGVGTTTSVQKALDLVRRHEPDRAVQELEKRKEPVAKVAAAAIRGWAARAVRAPGADSPAL